MILGAFLDLGMPLDYLTEKLKPIIEQYGVKITARRVSVNSIVATKVEILVSKDSKSPRTISEIERIIKSCGLSEKVEGRAIEILKKIGSAEAKVHGIDVAHVHFHEVGAIDSIIDIVGVSLALEYFGEPLIYASPVPLGRGFIDIEHGRVPLPAPAVMELLLNVPVYGINTENETVTPTGAGVLKTIVSKFCNFPSFFPEKVGLGAGSRYKDSFFPSLLRIIKGRMIEEEPENIATNQPNYVVIDTNIDDINPQLLPYVVERLLEEGAKDAWLENILMKKGRPAYKLSVICGMEELPKIVNIIFKETTTLGVRFYPVLRIELQRTVTTVEMEGEPIRIKVAKIGDKIYNVSSEFEDCKKLSMLSGKPLKVVIEEVKDKVELKGENDKQ